MKQLVCCPKCKGWQYVELISSFVHTSMVKKEILFTVEKFKCVNCETTETTILEPKEHHS